MVEAEKMVKELQAQNQALMKENEGLKGQAIEIQKYKIDKDFELGIIRDKT
jgi:Tfp pilus assembly protein PilN